jgi:hypothetical protein
VCLQWGQSAEERKMRETRAISPNRFSENEKRSGKGAKAAQYCKRTLTFKYSDFFANHIIISHRFGKIW